MKQPANHIMPEEGTPKETLSRRQLLKALAATGGAVSASSLLPGKWVKPVVEVGLLPAHAQVTPTPMLTPTPTPTPTPTEEPLMYSVECDSTPGGGDLTLRQGLVEDIQPRIEVISGTGPVAGITATMTVNTVQGPTPTFSPALPQTTTTNASGQAVFGDLQVTNQTTGQEFLLVFDFDVPSGTAHAECGVFFFS
jgi:hypothetical protein